MGNLPKTTSVWGIASGGLETWFDEGKWQLTESGLQMRELLDQTRSREWRREVKMDGGWCRKGKAWGRMNKRWCCSVDQLHTWPRDYRMTGVVRDLHIWFGLGKGWERCWGSVKGWINQGGANTCWPVLR